MSFVQDISHVFDLVSHATKSITQTKPCASPRESQPQNPSLRWSHVFHLVSHSHKTHHSDEAMCFTSSVTPQNPSLRWSHVLHLVTHATKPITQTKPCASPRHSRHKTHHSDEAMCFTSLLTPPNPSLRWSHVFHRVSQSHKIHPPDEILTVLKVLQLDAQLKNELLPLCFS